MIFEDESGRRKRAALWVAAAIVASAACVLAVHRAGLAEDPRFRPLPLPSTAGAPRSASSSAPTDTPASAPTSDAPPSEDYLALLAAQDEASERLVATLASPAHPLPEDTRLVFTVSGDTNGARRVDTHREAITALAPDVFRIPGDDCTIRESIDDATGRWLRDPAQLVFPRVANLDGDRWTSAESARLLRDDAARGCLVRNLVARAQALSADGLNLDFEALAPEDAHPYLRFLVELREALHAASMRLTVDVAPLDPSHDLRRIGLVADAVVVMAYDEHHVASGPGPIASPTFLARTLTLAGTIPAERRVVALGSYCYDFRLDGGGARSLGFDEAMALAARTFARPSFDPSQDTTAFRYQDGDVAHEVHCLDALAVTNQLARLADAGIRRVALWRAGSEDVSLWSSFAPHRSGDASAALVRMPAPDETVVVGEGPLHRRLLEARDGRRTVRTDAHGRIVEARYEQVPSPRIVESRAADSDAVVLTFDDGPDPVHTPALLDVLRRHGVRAAFFVVGEQAAAHPELVQRMVREGHLVGNHTHAHPHLEALDDDARALEVRTAERVLEGILGSHTPLFRAPYRAMLDPRDPTQLALVDATLATGYVFVGADVDPHDWSGTSAATIVARIVADVDAGGRLVVLHDGGGDRRATVEAVDRVIPQLRALGHRFGDLEGALGTSRASLVQPLSVDDRAYAAASSVVVGIAARGYGALGLLFTICTVLAALRIAALAFLVVRGERRRSPAEHSDGEADATRPLVTVLVPAYNEEVVIASTIRSLLEADYAPIEVLVIDDGSTDRTAEIAEGLAARDARVRCLRKPNGGKAAAANLGLEHARGAIVVAVDADTVVLPDAIGRMVRHFRDPRVSAVCGNVEVGNVNAPLTAFQAIEYVTSQNFDRRAFAAINAVSVVPGALGAWRRDVVRSVGGYSHDTLVEDADLTLTVLRAGGVIRYEPGAIARTEAPESILALYKQRFRWTFGTFQCLVKHRAAIFRGPVGLAALPNVVLFQILFPLLSPLGDLALLHSAFAGELSAIASGYLGFLAMDVVASAFAFHLDRKPMRWLVLLLVQRFTYRQFLYFVSLRAMVSAIAGARHGWRKLDRSGSVGLPTTSESGPLPMPEPIGRVLAS